MDVKSATAEKERESFLVHKVAHDHAIAPKFLDAHLLGPITDKLLIGGASIIACLLYWALVDSAAPLTNIGLMAFYASFIVNYPHFAASYQLLYWDYRKQILRRKSFFWAAVISPILIVGGIAAGMIWGSHNILIFMIQTMFLSVGWHYVKQIYGVSLVASAIQKRYLGIWEKNFILLNLYSVWAMSWVNSNLGTSRNDLNGFAYFSLGLPHYLLTVTYASTAITGIIALGLLVRKYILTGSRPSTTSLVGFASIYFWYIPVIYHPLFFYTVPFFHSLQYLLFVLALKKNEVAHSAQNLAPVAQRKHLVLKFGGFLLFALILGTFGFELAPNTLDATFPIGAVFGLPALWYFGFNLFINLHHYFIDNVIWRGDNEYLKIHLVQASQKAAP